MIISVRTQYAPLILAPRVGCEPRVPQADLVSGKPVCTPLLSGWASVEVYAHSLSSSLPRDLEARAQKEFFRAFFRLPRKEKLHAVVDCALWTPFSRCHTAGRMFSSDSYICFASREDGCCNVVLPLREVELESHGAALLCASLPLGPKCLSLVYVAQTKHSRSNGSIARRGLAHRCCLGSDLVKALSEMVAQWLDGDTCKTESRGQSCCCLQSSILW